MPQNNGLTARFSITICSITNIYLYYDLSPCIRSLIDLFYELFIATLSNNILFRSQVSNIYAWGCKDFVNYSWIVFSMV